MGKRVIALILGGLAGAALVIILAGRAAALIGTRMAVTEEPPGRVAPGEEFTFAGYLEDENWNRLSGKTIELYLDDSVATSVTTGADGGWSFTVSVPKGTHTLRAQFPGDDTYRGCGKFIL